MAARSRSASRRRPSASSDRVSSSRYFARQPPGMRGMSDPATRADEQLDRSARRDRRSPCGRLPGARRRRSRRSSARGHASARRSRPPRPRPISRSPQLDRHERAVEEIPGERLVVACEARAFDRAVEHLRRLDETALYCQHRSRTPGSTSAGALPARSRVPAPGRAGRAPPPLRSGRGTPRRRSDTRSHRGARRVPRPSSRR